jgi:SAM-dependent methyltransferase
VRDHHRILSKDGNAIMSIDQTLDWMWSRFGRQLRNPTGFLGLLVGWFMAIVNDKPNRLAIDALAPCPGDQVLELGFGPGWALRTIAARTPGGRVFGVDQSDRMLQQAANMNQAAIAAGRMQLIKGKFSPLPWIDCTFNKILLVNVVYFFDPDGNDAAEVFRVLKPGGRLVVYVTARETMEKWPFAGPDTHRTYDTSELRSFLENAGFQRAGVRIQTLTLPFGIRGLLATAEKLYCSSVRFG